MTSALVVVLLIACIVVTDPDSDAAEFSTNNSLYALRLIGALLIATLVPLLIDRRARRSSRVRH